MKYVIVFIFLTTFCLAQNIPSFYYVSIGSSDYEQEVKDSLFIPFENLPEASYSAITMQGVLEKNFNAKGIQYNSTNQSKVNKKLIFSLLDRVTKMIKKDNHKNPFLIFYYCGHGISENLAWNQFLIPGDYQGDSTRTDFDSMIKDLIFLGEINEYLISKKYKFLMLVDCCRKENHDTSFPEKRMQYFFTEQNVETLKTLVFALKYLNEFHQQNPVVFSIKPGDLAPVVPYPELQHIEYKPNVVTPIGPLCRRSLILFDSYLGTKSTLTLDKFIKLLTSNELDKETPLPVCNFEDENNIMSKLILIKSN
jgi:hypothetical protein